LTTRREETINEIKNHCIESAIEGSLHDNTPFRLGGRRFEGKNGKTTGYENREI
jgi:hypothetical protein